MKMSIARALKEKNRLVKEIDRLWGIIQSENSCLVTHERSADIEGTLKLIDHYTEKLVEIKTKIGNANQQEQLHKMHLLDETKNKLSKLNATSGSTDSEDLYKTKERTAVFDEPMLNKMKHQLQLEANRLQDELDAYNAENKIDFETPL